ncbi:helix-turn-helix transcriptional regulator [Myxococcus sp. K15C18031901]|uniref:helix-turn-helix domain-containing protein n=1 Tax=Myxococcus dinghuensis TaxID=2906761 RepID=UPI0020A81C1F|nr:helix-turn-helix domain-containing protein [Myxococcus dinghuensis]MCP3100537.1 helix-turn-helix transcriptional regulator [Myxococcus dinghuensis]
MAPTPPALSGPGPGAAFATQLKHWRHARKLSQLELSLRAHVSQKHVSFLEVGRTHPSRDMVLLLAHVLDLSPHERNVFLETAGFTGTFTQSTRDDASMRPVVEALDVMLSHLDPNPAFVVDGTWDIVRLNTGMRRLTAALAFDPAPLQRVVGESRARNMMRQLFHPAGLRERMVNWTEVAPRMLAHLRRQLQSRPSEALANLYTELLGYPDVADLPLPPPDAIALPLVTPIEYAHGAFRIRLLSMCSTFGNPQDITTDPLRIESFFPADEEARQHLHALQTSERKR